MKNRILLIAAIIITLAAFGCAKKEAAGSKVIARVSSRKITLKELQDKIAKMPPYYREVVTKDPKRYLEDVIVEALCYEEGVRRGIDRDKEVKEVVSEAKKKIVMAKLIKNEVEDKIKITEEEMKKYYEDRKDEFKAPEMWRASHILVADEKDARAILDELAKGANFETIAKERSIDATASRGGDVGYFRSGQLVPEFEKACMKLNVGETSDIVRTQFGYHIIKLTDKKEPGIQSYQEARRAVEAELKKKKRSELFNDLVSRLKNKYGVEINENALK